MLDTMISHSHRLRQLLQSDDCAAGEEEFCNNPSLAQKWAIASFFFILVGSAVGVCLPLLSHKVRWLRVGGMPFAVGRAFSAGVVLATGFVHMFPEALEALGNPCLGWIEFPWAACIAVGSALFTALIEFVAGQVLHARALKKAADELAISGLEDGTKGGSGLMDDQSAESMEGGKKPATYLKDASSTVQTLSAQKGSVVGRSDGTIPMSPADRAWIKARKHAVAQVLEWGIALHSVLIGITVGVSSSPCTIRPLAAALVFHQFFEGFALGGALIDAAYKLRPYLMMAAFFSLTTPGGIALGIGIKSTFNDNSPANLATAGFFDAVSCGILIYLALVSLIATEFFGERMKQASKTHQFLSFLALFAGAGAMCFLAKWA